MMGNDDPLPEADFTDEEFLVFETLMLTEKLADFDKFKDVFKSIDNYASVTDVLV